MTAYTHHFSSDEWPFQDRINTAAYANSRVVLEDHPVLLVTHEKDGEWQILSGTTNAKKDRLVICLGCAFEKDRSIGEVADLPLGWKAWRKSPEDPWERAENKKTDQSLSGKLFALGNRFLHPRG